MTESLALEMIRRKGEEMGRAHTLEHRDLRLQPLEIRHIDAADQLYVILFADGPIVIQSEMGVYDHFTDQNAENIHTHSGRISIENRCDKTPKDVEFLQAIWTNRRQTNFQ